MNSKNSKTIAIILGILLLLSLIFNFVLNGKVRDLESSNVANSESFMAQKSSLQSELDSLDIEIENLQNINLKKDSTLQSTLAELETKKNNLQQMANRNDLSQKELNSLRREIGTLRSQVNRYKAEVERLTAENQSLRGTNDTLNMENNRIRGQRDSITGDYRAAKADSENKSALIQRTVSVSNFTIVPVKVRKSGKEVVKDRHQAVNKLKVNFTLDPNTAGVSETKTLYICIYKPDGSLASFENGNSGSFTSKDGVPINYSDKVNTSYSNQSGGNVVFDWDYDKFTAGTYKIDIWQNGFKIGQERRDLK